MLRLIRIHLKKQTFTIKVSSAQEDLLVGRLDLLVHQILPEVRSDGNLLLPVSYHHGQGEITVNTMAYPADRPDGRYLDADELLTALRSACALLSRLHDKQYMLGRDLQSAILFCRRKETVTAALCLVAPPDAGKQARVLGFSVTEKDEKAMPRSMDTPEGFRREYAMLFGKAAPTDPREDVYALSLLFANLMTGDAAGSPAVRHCLVIPQPMLPLYGPLDVMLRTGMSARTSQRPGSRELLEGLSMMHAGDVRGFSGLSGNGKNDRLSSAHAFHQRFAVDTQGRPCAVIFLETLHSDTPLSGKKSAWMEAMEQRVRTTKRVLACAQQWAGKNRAFLKAEMQTFFHADTLTVPLTGGPLVMLSRVREVQKSTFLLDMRMVDLLYAVQCVHDAGAVFGAMPESLFAVDPSDTECPVRVLDLSTVFFTDDPPAWQHLRIAPDALETLSPEMHLAGCGIPAPGGVTAASDIFALGILYHRLLTGKTPDPGSRVTVGHAVSHAKETADAVQLHPGLDRQHQALIVQMLSFLPSDRPRSCIDIAGEIMAFYTG